MNPLIRKIYYFFKPVIHRNIQIRLRRGIIKKIKKKNLNWPINEEAGKIPEGWGGWPENKKFALILTHDVDTKRGYNNIEKLLMLEKEMGFVSSFNLVPKRDYRVSQEMIDYITRAGFEVGLHGLKHDGKDLERGTFEKRIEKMNEYIQEWNAFGFRAPSMIKDLDLIAKLDVLYDTSTFDVDPFEPQPEGVRTIFPYKIKVGEKEYIELPYTLPQDFTLFILMQNKTIDIWKKKLDWVAEKGGMALMNIHPDYINFTNAKNEIDQYSAEYYKEFLDCVLERYSGQYWNVLPREAAFCANPQKPKDF